MGKVWDAAPGGRPPRDLTPSEIGVLERMLGSGGRLALTAQEASDKAIVDLQLREIILPSVHGRGDVLEYKMTTRGYALCDRLRLRSPASPR